MRMALMSTLPGKGVAQLDGGVPGVHGSGSERIANAGIALSGEPWRAPGSFTPEANALNAEFPDDVMRTVILRGVIHR
jgi:hypothetical protein